MLISWEQVKYCSSFFPFVFLSVVWYFNCSLNAGGFIQGPHRERQDLDVCVNNEAWTSFSQTSVPPVRFVRFFQSICDLFQLYSHSVPGNCARRQELTIPLGYRGTSCGPQTFSAILADTVSRYQDSGHEIQDNLFVTGVDSFLTYFVCSVLVTFFKYFLLQLTHHEMHICTGDVVFQAFLHAVHLMLVLLFRTTWRPCAALTYMFCYYLHVGITRTEIQHFDMMTERAVGL